MCSEDSSWRGKVGGQARGSGRSSQPLPWTRVGPILQVCPETPSLTLGAREESPTLSGWWLAGLPVPLAVLLHPKPRHQTDGAGISKDQQPSDGLTGLDLSAHFTLGKMDLWDLQAGDRHGLGLRAGMGGRPSFILQTLHGGRLHPCGYSMPTWTGKI